MRSDALRRTQNGNLSNTYCEMSNCEEFISERQATHSACNEGGNQEAISERQATHMRLGPPGALSMQ